MFCYLVSYICLTFPVLLYKLREKIKNIFVIRYEYKQKLISFYRLFLFLGIFLLLYMTDFSPVKIKGSQEQKLALG